jgi:hypothetical protein
MGVLALAGGLDLKSMRGKQHRSLLEMLEDYDDGESSFAGAHVAG